MLRHFKKVFFVSSLLAETTHAAIRMPHSILLNITHEKVIRTCRAKYAIILSSYWTLNMPNVRPGSYAVVVVVVFVSRQLRAKEKRKYRENVLVPIL